MTKTFRAERALEGFFTDYEVFLTACQTGRENAMRGTYNRQKNVADMIRRKQKQNRPMPFHPSPPPTPRPKKLADKAEKK
jgi:hypothetical protein